MEIAKFVGLASRFGKKVHQLRKLCAVLREACTWHCASTCSCVMRAIDQPASFASACGAFSVR